MKPGPELLTFDCYGTLVDWRRGMREALYAVWGPADRSLEPHADHVIRCYMAREVELEKTWRPYREVLEEALGLAIEEATGAEATASERRAFAETIGSWPAFPETRAVLEALRADGRRIAILSNVDDDMIARSIDVIGVPFDWVVTAQAVRSYKPRPAHWERILAESGIPKAEILHVGASLLHDIEPASRLGFRTVWIDRLPEHWTDGLRPDQRLPDLRGLPALVG